jgi:hypothetical protein
MRVRRGLSRRIPDDGRAWRVGRALGREEEARDVPVNAHGLILFRVHVVLAVADHVECQLLVDSGTTAFGLEVAVSGPTFMCQAVGLNARRLAKAAGPLTGSDWRKRAFVHVAGRRSCPHALAATDYATRAGRIVAAKSARGMAVRSGREWRTRAPAPSRRLPMGRRPGLSADRSSRG